MLNRFGSFLYPKNKREIPKLVPDDPKTGAWRSQNWCLTVRNLVPAPAEMLEHHVNQMQNVCIIL